MKYLIKIIKFRFSIWKELFSADTILSRTIYLIVLALILMVSKIVVCNVGIYSNTALFITIFFSFVSIDVIFPKKITQTLHTVKNFFDKIPEKKYKRYLTYRGFIYLNLSYIYLLFPIKKEDVSAFAICFFILETYILLASFIRLHLEHSRFITFKWMGQGILCALYFINNRASFFKLDSVDLNIKLMILFFGGCIIQMVLSIQNIKKISEIKQIHLISHKFKWGFLNKNKDFLYVLRSDALLDPFMITIFSGIISYVMKEQLKDMLLTNIASFSYVFYSVYTKLLKYENKSYTLLYPEVKHFYFKIEKIKNTMFIVIPTLAILSIPLIFVTSFKAVVISFFVSIIIFIVNAFLFRINIEKKKGYRYVITTKEEYILLLINVIEIFAITFI